MKDKIVLGNFWKLYGAGVLHKDITDFVPMSAEQWEHVRRIARRNKLYGLVLDGISHVPEDKKLPRPFIDKWAMEMAQFTRTHWDNNRVIADLFHRWREAGVRPVLLKGQGYARMYHTPSLRMIGDIDVFVCQDEFDRAMEVVNSLPLDSDEFPDIGKHIEFFYRKTGVELHRKPAEIFHCRKLDLQFQRWSEQALADSSCGFYIDEKGQYADTGTWITTPPPTFDVFYNFLHLWGHIYCGPMQIKSLADWVIMLRSEKGNFDLTELEYRLRQFKLLRYWQWVGCLVVKYMGGDSSDIPFYNPAEMNNADKLFRYIHREMFATRYDYRSKRNFKRKWHNLKHFIRHHSNQFLLFPKDAVARDFNRHILRGIRGLFFKTTQDGEYLKA